ncbi:NAD(P)/FAD-dependent oxidoreductase [Corynebacterium aquilae]|uniref:Sarcosine oxidase subunit beta n=1 Tax=Corynebacterium aquilae DSM 44791 TaxID=1431546 RepID=A0A1L7CFI5_9CORY|nr:FAD-binding oxidoreductase [Corynebacterium aquilae]APT84597.1 sarcosine oxidase subunit beta [Corynebacterium aquilae DSM 44791]
MKDLAVPLELSYTDRQPKAADVVIIGGGVMGMSAAWHLAERGVRRIVVVEQSELGSGSSAKPLGGVRANFSDEANIILGKRSLDFYGTFQENFGVDISLNRVGYLFLAHSDCEAECLAQSTQTQNALGVNSVLVTPDEAALINPYLDPASLTAASFSPQDGHASPAAVVAGLTRACLAKGVTIVNRTQVLDIDRQGDRITGVVTNRGHIATDRIVCAAGAWSGAIGDMAGVWMPVEPVRRMIGLTRQLENPHPTIPFTLDLSTTFYFHNYGNGLLLGISHMQEPGFCREFSYDWLAEFNDAASVYAPRLENPDLVGGWAGYYENTPDHNALIGAADLDGFYYITGFSGHGFLQAPAAGELLADIMLDRESFIDKEVFSAKRFGAKDRMFNEVNII